MTKNKRYLLLAGLAASTTGIIWLVTSSPVRDRIRSVSSLPFSSAAGLSGTNVPSETEGLSIEDEALTARKAMAGLPAPYRISEAEVAAGSTVGRTLQNLGLGANAVATITAGVKPLWNLAKIAAGTPVAVAWKDATDTDPLRVEFKLSESRTLIATKDDDQSWYAEFRDEEITKRIAAYSGVVATNLWSSAAMAGMDAQIIQKMAEVFAWQIDFNREVHLDDRWRLTVEQLFVKGKPIGYGEILAAEYDNAGVVSSAVRFAQEGSSVQYFAPDGRSLRRMFLKGPMKFGRVTSGFSSGRFHPILKINRPHNGVDYGAPTGTPVMSVGDGTVVFAGPKGPSGNMVTIRHNAVYETNYKHFSRFAAGIRRGSRVEMGQVIGYVGATGLATGPHLHFEFHENGRYVDPQGLKFPAAEPVAADQMDAFATVAQGALAELPPWSEAVLTQKRKDSAQAHNE